MSNEKLIGTRAFNAIAGLYEKYAVDLDQVAKTIVQEYAFSEDYDSKEMRAYRAGVQDLVAFFQVCHAERTNKQDDSAEGA